MAESRPVNARTVIIVAVSAALLLVALFDIRFVYDVSSGSTREVPDPAVEEAFGQCFAAADEALHERAFATIDNPDVQREFITSERAAARRECRARYPEAMVVVEEPSGARLFEFSPRFW
jgi:hypothetical protein